MKKSFRFWTTLVVVIIGIAMMASVAQAVEKTVEWDASPGDPAGYRISISNDGGVTWTQEADVAATVLQTTITVPDTGLTLIRASAYNNIGESLNTISGVWFNPDWEMSAAPTGLRSPGSL